MHTLLDGLTVRLAALAATIVSLAFVTGCIGDPWPRPATAVVAAGRAYAEAPGGPVLAIDARTGAVIRRVPAGGFAAVDGLFYVGGKEVQAIDVASGNVVWRIPPRPDTSYHYVAADAQHVYFQVRVLRHAEPFVMPDGRLVAVDRATGRELWSVTMKRPEALYPVDGVVIALEGSLLSPKLVARDAATGATRWTADEPQPWDPLVASGHVFVLTGSDVRELDPATGRETWRGPTGGLGSTADASTLYLRSGLEVDAIDLASKRPRWKQPCAGQLGAGDGLVVCATTTAVARRADTGAVAWRIELPAAALNRPVIAEGVVLFRTSHTELMAVDASTGKARWKLDLATGALSPPGQLVLREDGTALKDGARVSLEEVPRCNEAPHAEAVRARHGEIAGIAVMGVGVLGVLVSSVVLGVAGLSRTPRPGPVTAGVAGDLASIPVLLGGLRGYLSARDHARSAVRLCNLGAPPCGPG